MKNKTFIIVVCLITLTLGVTIGGTFFANAMSTIDVPDEKMIVLGSNNKYVIVDPVTDLSQINESLLENPTGEYDSGSILKVLGNSYIATTTSVGIGGIIGDTNTHARIVEGSNIEINSTLEYGINVYMLSVSTEMSKVKTFLKVSGKSVAIGFKYQIDFFNTSVTANAVDYGILCNEEDLFNNSYFKINDNSSLEATASSKSGIAIKINYLECYGSKISAKATNGVSGLKATMNAHVSASMFNEKEYASEIHAFSYTGRAISVSETGFSGNMNIVSSKVFGETEKGEAGVHADYIYVYSEETYAAKAYVEGKANVGYGVVGQNLDTDNDFPSGNIFVNESTVRGHVNEGMGVSTNYLSSYGGSVEGVAEKGLGISTCMGSVHDSDVSGISRGPSEKHFQVYGSIPDSVGINFLSGFSIAGKSTLVGTAPKDDEKSFGVHGLLFYEGQTYRSGHFGVNTEEGKDLSITAEGGVGIFVGTTLSLYSNGSSKVSFDIIGGTDGIQIESLDLESSDGDKVVVNATGEKGAGIRSLALLSENNNNRMNISNAIFNVTGNDFGIWYQLGWGGRINKSKITATATSGSGIHIENTSVDMIMDVEVIDSEIEATGKRYGMYSKESNVFFKSEIFDSTSTFQGGETALYLDFDKNEATTEAITGLHLMGTEHSTKIKAISTAVSPDKEGRAPAVFAALYNVSDGSVLTEEYIFPLDKNLSPQPFFAYALGQNIAKYENYDWSGSSIPIIVSSEGVATDKLILDEKSIVATRKGNVDEELGKSGLVEPINLNTDGVHNVIFRTKSKKFVAIFYSDKNIEWYRKNYYSGTLLELPEEPKKEGYTFKNWEDKLSGKEWDFLLDMMPESDLELIAAWEKIAVEPAETERPTSDPSTTDDEPPPTGQSDSVIALLAIVAVMLLLIFIVKRRGKLNDDNVK